MSKNITFDWMLHAPMVFAILQDLEYFKHRGVSFELKGSVIRKHGGCPYSPSEITSFRDAETVLRDEGAACTPHFDAVCLFEGVSFHAILGRGRDLINRIRDQSVV